MFDNALRRQPQAAAPAATRATTPTSPLRPLAQAAASPQQCAPPASPPRPLDSPGGPPSAPLDAATLVPEPAELPAPAAAPLAAAQPSASSHLALSAELHPASEPAAPHAEPKAGAAAPAAVVSPRLSASGARIVRSSQGSTSTQLRRKVGSLASTSPAFKSAASPGAGSAMGSPVSPPLKRMGLAPADTNAHNGEPLSASSARKLVFER